MNYTFTGFKPELIPRLQALIDAYTKEYPAAVTPPAVSYLAPWTEEGRNVICAFDETGKLCGFTPVSLADVPDKPYTFWTAIRTHPEVITSRQLRDALLEKIKERAAEIVENLPTRKCRIAFQHRQTERENIDYVISQGGTYTESVYLMKRDLTQELTALSLPDGIEIRYSGMTDEFERQAYLAVRNEAFVKGRPHELSNSAVSMDDWQILLHHVYLPNGTFILAYHDEQIVGGITVFRNEETGQTDDVFVSENWRNQGIASYLIGKGLEYFKTQGFKTAQLEVNSANKRALGLYEKQGYVLEDENPFYIIPLEIS